jgi:hypothetical protein
VSAANVATDLRVAVVLQGPTVGFIPKDISASALQAGGAMPLLFAQVDTHLIQLLGHWRSDSMLRYLLPTFPTALLLNSLAADNGWL